jgi:hypothetical protein
MSYDEIIQNPDYIEIESVKHSDIKAQVIKEFKENRGWAVIANVYQIIGVLSFIAGASTAFIHFYEDRETVYLLWAGIGLVFTFTLLIVFHELIHAVAFKLIGANNLTFGMVLRKYIFYVEADHELINYSQSKKVALAPVVIIGLISLTGMAVFYIHPVFYFFLSVLSIHSLLCSGDFGILCFFQNRPDMEILTYDRKDEKKTYFYGKMIKNIK